MNNWSVDTYKQNELLKPE